MQVSTDKNEQPKSWELRFLCSLAEDLSPGASLSDCYEELLWGDKGGARIYRSFDNKNQVVGTSKDYC